LHFGSPVERALTQAQGGTKLAECKELFVNSESQASFHMLSGLLSYLSLSSIKRKKATKYLNIIQPMKQLPHKLTFPKTLNKKSQEVIRTVLATGKGIKPFCHSSVGKEDC